MQDSSARVAIGLVSSAGRINRNNFDTHVRGEEGSGESKTAEDVLGYITDMLAQLEAMAERYKLEAVSDILGFSQRQVERTRTRGG